MERIFVLPNGVQASIRTTDPRYNCSSLPELREDVPVVFHVSSTEGLKRVICRFIDLPKGEREEVC